MYDKVISTVIMAAIIGIRATANANDDNIRKEHREELERSAVVSAAVLPGEPSRTVILRHEPVRKDGKVRVDLPNTLFTLGIAIPGASDGERVIWRSTVTRMVIVSPPEVWSGDIVVQKTVGKTFVVLTASTSAHVSFWVYEVDLSKDFGPPPLKLTPEDTKRWPAHPEAFAETTVKLTTVRVLRRTGVIAEANSLLIYAADDHGDLGVHAAGFEDQDLDPCHRGRPTSVMRRLDTVIRRDAPTERAGRPRHRGGEAAVSSGHRRFEDDSASGTS
jgi:hypothetical protein